MNSYKAISWFSVLLIIGEGLLLSELKLEPVAGGKDALVLGESTHVLLEQLETTPFPASYYTEVEEVSEVEPESEQIAVDAEVSKDGEDEVVVQQSAVVLDTAGVLDNGQVEKAIEDDHPIEQATSESVSNVTGSAYEEEGEEAGVSTTLSKEEQNSPPTTPQISEESDLDRMVRVLNLPSEGGSEVVVGESDDSDAANRVSRLIQKNKRYYFLDIKDELEKIRQGLDE